MSPKFSIPDLENAVTEGFAGLRESLKPMDEFTVYDVGLCYASVCTRLDDDAATERLNSEHPTGFTPWQVSTDATFADGSSPNPCPCPDDVRNRHVLFNC